MCSSPGGLADPHGAYFCVWQARDRIDAKLVNMPGLAASIQV
jgi:hypothetical protein